jgi:CHAT domain-containing protein
MRLKGLLLLLWLFMLCLNNINSQNNFTFYDSIYKSNSRNITQKLVDSLLNLSIDEHFSTRKISHEYSIFMYKKKDYLKAIKYAKIEVKSFEKHSAINKVYIKALYNLGRFYIFNLQFDDAIKVFEKIIKINIDPQKKGHAYAEIGRCYSRKNKLYESINYYKKGILILENLKDYKSLVSQYINLAIAYDFINSESSLNSSLYYRKKAQYILENNRNPSLRSVYSLNAGFANYYNTHLKYNFNKSREYLFKNLKVSLKEHHNEIIVNSYINLGDLYLKEKKDSAFYFLNKGLFFSKDSSLSKAELFRSLAIYHKNKSEYNLALNSIDKSIFFLTKGGLLLEEVKDKRMLLSSLKKKIEILTSYKNKTGKSNTYLANEVLIKADKLIGIIQNNDLTEFSSKLFWRKEASEVYLKGVYISYLLNDPKRVFYFMEKNKAILLMESIIKNTKQVNLPKNIIDTENELKKVVINLENKIDKKDAKQQDSLFKTKLVYQKYIDSIKIVYPKYFKNQLEINQINLTEVQSNLGKDEVVVSYIWNKFVDNKELLLGFIINNNETKTFRVENVITLKENLKKYRNLISKPFETKKQKEDFQKISHILYKQLFPKGENRNLLINKKVLIIPDGSLQNVPFESLIIKENTFDYLLKFSTISYGYSMSFLKYNSKIIRKTSNNYIGYSPISFENQKLESLNNTGKEITTIQNIIGGAIFLNNDAKKNHFLLESGNSKIIHLATHADATENPWIAFSDENLELHELYTYKNNADLVVLSACNTSLGEIAEGEGVLSLARGFFYSGAKSVVSSLWNVNDKSTSFIMTDFYKNLKSGETKSEALTNAKRAYLKNHTLSEQSPYYWSSFVLIGDANSIELSNYNHIFLIILFILVIVFYFFKKKVKL